MYVGEYQYFITFGTYFESLKAEVDIFQIQK